MEGDNTMKVRCMSKNRNDKGNIINYTLQDETGKIFQATAQQIKAEMQGRNFEFTNLQIDKAGRLVDKAEAKIEKQAKVTKKHENIFNILNLINHDNVKDTIIKAYDFKDKKMKHLVGTSYWGQVDVGIHNSVYAYSEEEGRLYMVSAGNLEAKTEKERYLPAEKMQSGKYKIGLVINSYYIVDLKPNKKGQYTIIEIGSYKQEFIDKIFDIDIYRVKDNKTGEIKWVNGEFLNTNMDLHAGKNAFTNACIQMDNLKIIDREKIKHRDVNQEMNLYRNLEKSIEGILEYEVIHGMLYVDYEEGKVTASEDTMRRLKKAEMMFDEFCNSIEIFNLDNKKFSSIIVSIAQDKLMEMKDVYWVGLEECEVYISKSLYKIKDTYKTYMELYYDAQDYIFTNLDI